MKVLLTLIVATCVLGCQKTVPTTGVASTERQRFLIATTTQPHPQETLLSNITQITTGFSRAGEAYFSPQMDAIIFQAVPQGEAHYQMYIAPIHVAEDSIDVPTLSTWFGKTRNPWRISPDNSRNTCGYFSPDGKSLIFASTVGKEKPDAPAGGYQRQGRSYVWAFPTGMEIYRMDLDQETFRLSQHVGPGGPSIIHWRTNLVPLTHNDVYDAEASYSPDGKWICYTHGAGKDADIYVMRSDGSNPVRITSAPGYDGGPFFSPDGKRLVYRSDRKSDDLLQIFVADLAFDPQGNITGLAKEQQLTDDNHVNWGPYWHPEGRHIIYASSAVGHQNYELFLMNDDGANKTRVTYQPGADVLPVFSPDGKWLMWTSKRSADSTTQVFAARFMLPASRQSAAAGK